MHKMNLVLDLHVRHVKQTQCKCLVHAVLLDCVLFRGLQQQQPEQGKRGRGVGLNEQRQMDEGKTDGSPERTTLSHRSEGLSWINHRVYRGGRAHCFLHRANR